MHEGYGVKFFPGGRPRQPFGATVNGGFGGGFGGAPGRIGMGSGRFKGQGFGAGQGFGGGGGFGKGFSGAMRGASKGAGGWMKELGDFGSRRMNIGRFETSIGRAGIVGGLGFMAARNGANMIDRMQYGDYGGAMMSGALTAAAGAGAYQAAMYKGAFRGHFNAASSWLMKNFSRAVK